MLLGQLLGLQAVVSRSSGLTSLVVVLAGFIHVTRLRLEGRVFKMPRATTLNVHAAMTLGLSLGTR